ncbi:anthranilate synthase component I family protein [Paenibacillus sp. GCM10027627]
MTETYAMPAHDSFQAYLKLKSYFGQSEVFLLESLSGPAKDAQSTILGFKPLLTLNVWDRKVQLSGNPGLSESIVRDAIELHLLSKNKEEISLVDKEDLWNLLRFIQARFAASAEGDGNSFTFGYFGYFGYDTASYIEQLPRIIAGDESVPDVSLTIYQGLIDYNLIEGTTRLILNQAPLHWESIDRKEIETIVFDSISVRGFEEDGVVEPDQVDFTIEQQQYEENVKKALSYIAKGDIYQVQIGHQIHVKSKVDPIEVYKRLRLRNPSPYMYLAPFGEITLIGASPELFVKVQDDLITMRPIAGTCPRGKTPMEDDYLVLKLKTDEKEIAEHIMLVDLCRNDIGRVCSPGTLEVDDLMTIEQYSHVNHLVSSVTGVKERKMDAYAIIAATFPAGTMTGAPKVRAMEIIEELETTRRGPYAGALGFIDFSGFVNMALCIRTTIHNASKQEYYLRASAGVVADSKPEMEWRETFHKLAATYWAVTGKEVVYESVGS